MVRVRGRTHACTRDRHPSEPWLFLRDAGPEIFTRPGYLNMSRTFFFVALFLPSTAFLLGCGGGSKAVVTPQPQPQITDAFMFLQEVPNQATSFTPMTGEYSVLGNDVTFQAIPAQDPSSGQVLPMPLGATNVWDPTCSPDGSMIAVEASDDDGVTTTFHGIVLMDADGSNAQLITNPYSATCDCWDGYPAFTPDSSQIVFAGATNASSGNSVDLDITNLQRRATTQAAESV